MFSRTSVLVGCLIGAAAFATGFATAGTAEEGPAIKSHHLLNLPSELSEADLAEALGKLNAGVAEAGYPEAGYSLWKVTGEQSGDYAYLWEGDWPSQEGYDAIHESESWQAAAEAITEVFEALSPQHVYNRYTEIPVGGMAGE
jgi:hypothetical protein